MLIPSTPELVPNIMGKPDRSSKRESEGNVAHRCIEFEFGKIGKHFAVRVISKITLGPVGQALMQVADAS